jgi:tetratricopeptide (TPR) repeat protein
MRTHSRTFIVISALVAVGHGSTTTFAQEPVTVSAADSAFEAEQWALAIDEYRKLVDENPDDGISWLRIAQAQRNLDQHTVALETLQTARATFAPEAMVELERARNLVSLDQLDTALRALESSDHLGLRALASLSDAPEFDALRDNTTFQRVYRSVRRRVFPCEDIAAAREFDFWIGNWEVRLADGTLIGNNSISRSDGGCAILEQWSGAGGSTGTSMTYFQPSRDQWRQLWVGSNGTLIDISGGMRDGQMYLEGTIEYFAQERIEAFRGTWSTLPDGRVRQHFEEFSLIAQDWQTWFDGYYELTNAR